MWHYASEEPGTTTLTAPFPYFGGKRLAAKSIWGALGDVGGYVEPFCGSAAVLLARPPFTGRRVETINDADGWLVNAWRAIQLSPAEVAAHCSGPVTEIDYHARLAWLQERRTPDLVAWLEGDPEHHDAKAAGWWLYVVACGIGDPWNAGPWRVVDGHLRKVGDAGRGVNRELPHLGDAGRGVNRELPHLGDALAVYMHTLAGRLKRVRITCGDWGRVLKPSVTRSTAGNSITGILLDPPYSTGAGLYATTNSTAGAEDISNQVRHWCAEHTTGDDTPRIVLCGFNDDHDELLNLGWTKVLGKAGGRGFSIDHAAHRRERMWLSPNCFVESPSLFSLGEAE